MSSKKREPKVTELSEFVRIMDSEERLHLDKMNKLLASSWGKTVKGYSDRKVLYLKSLNNPSHKNSKITRKVSIEPYDTDPCNAYKCDVKRLVVGL